MSNFNASIKAILDTSGIPKQIKDIENKYSIKLGLGQFDKSNISQQMKNLGSKAGESFNQSFNSSLSKIKVNTGKSAISNMQKTLKSMNFKSSSIDVITQDLEQMNIAVNKVSTNLRGNNLRLSVQGVDELGRAITVVKQFNSETQQISTTSKSFIQSFAKSIPMASSLQVSTLDNKMEVWLQKNTRASKEFGGSIDQLRNRLNTLNSTGELTEKQLKEIETEFKEIKQAAISAGKTGKTFGDIFKGAFNSISKYIGVSTIIHESIRAIRELYENVVAIDTAMTNLYKVTDETDERYDKFLSNATKNAKELGRTVSSYIEQTADWTKLGYSLDQAEQLSKISSVYANVGEIGDEQAVSDMVTAMKAFEIEANNAVNIVDVLNELGNNFATSAGALGDGLSRSASAMATAGTDMYKTLAMLTGGTEITQNATEFGSFLKVASMRIRGMKGELEALGEEVDENVDSISKVQTQILNLTHGEVNIFDDTGNFREYYEIMKEISEVFDDLSSTEQASLSEILFGKMRGNQGAALIQAFQSGQIEKAYETALSSDGSALKEQEKWLESVEAKTQQFQAAWQGLSNTIMNTDVLKGAIDTGTGFLSVIDGLINHLGGLGIALVAIPPLIALSKWKPFADVLTSIKTGASNLAGGNKMMFL